MVLIIIFLLCISLIRLIGIWELWYFSEMMLRLEVCSFGNDFLYWCYFEFRVCFQLVLVLMLQLQQMCIVVLYFSFLIVCFSVVMFQLFILLKNILKVGLLNWMMFMLVVFSFFVFLLRIFVNFQVSFLWFLQCVLYSVLIIVIGLGSVYLIGCVVWWCRNFVFLMNIGLGWFMVLIMVGMLVLQWLWMCMVLCFLKLMLLRCLMKVVMKCWWVCLLLLMILMLVCCCFCSDRCSVFCLFLNRVLFCSFYGDQSFFGLVSQEGLGRLFVVEVGSSVFVGIVLCVLGENGKLMDQWVVYCLSMVWYGLMKCFLVNWFCLMVNWLCFLWLQMMWVEE